MCESLSPPVGPSVEFYLPVKPFGKQRHGQNKMTGVKYTPRETVTYERLIAYTAIKHMREAGLEKLEKRPVEVDLFMFYKIPASFSAKKRAECLSGVRRPTVKPDTDNVLKIVMDGLTGHAYRDDCVVVDNIVRKFYSEEWGIGVRFHEV
jgi:Holliday junction resolvase RusA-like endonuclease